MCTHVAPPQSSEASKQLIKALTKSPPTNDGRHHRARVTKLPTPDGEELLVYLLHHFVTFKLKILDLPLPRVSLLPEFQ